MHPRLTHRGPWLNHAKEKLPILHGTLIRLKVERLPGNRHPKLVWLWCSANAATPVDVDRWWQSFLRRFDLEHTFRLLKQTLGWTAPKVRHADSADLWTWLIIAAHTQLRLVRPLRRGSAPSLGATRLTPSPHPRSRPPRVSQRPCDGGPSVGRTETVQAGSGTASRLEEQAAGHTARRRQDGQTC